jgi:two-component system chemotaxis response regulator CheY
MKALVVDDSRAMRLLMSRMLADSGFDVAHAADGKEGLAYLVEHPNTAVALVDWNMPEMTGLELIESVRRDASLDGVRLMMVTTETEMTHIRRAMDAGANEYVMKPFNRDVILGKLRILGFPVRSPRESEVQ